MVVWYGRRRAARRRAANASSATLTADVGSSTQTCFIRCGKWQRVWQLFQSLNSVTAIHVQKQRSISKCNSRLKR